MYDAVISDLTGSEGTVNGIYGVESVSGIGEDIVMDGDLPVATPNEPDYNPALALVREYNAGVNRVPNTTPKALTKPPSAYERAKARGKREWKMHPIIIGAALVFGVMAWANRKK